ncbi:uncharacterized protein I206_100608 [Kwoniella pini CBS 10737]|uniref:SGT1-domain-containing protein n=1 Tax=Kwoniella pini CBS 10737 TaxID=1296096 RepID=A0A1B9IDB9_9TREE|nr:uncharacterized protein I206_00717 [Kwoniella pini CBS 10737]OCF53414.1 hypothetical protein I206_00717 [Kwoniella pini CBS 10737]
MSNSFPSLAHTPGTFPLPTIAEDTLHYSLHLPPTYEPTSTALLFNQYVETLLIRPWLWNKDSWELKVADSGNKLEGTMRVGDAVDDEWLVVWLLKRISEKWKDIVIGVRDTDGEFLLIEAANDLPAWVSPENAENRLWLQGGYLHLIPLSVRSIASKPRAIPDDEDMEKQYDPEAYISEEDAIQAVQTGKYRADEKVERAVWDRISCYPEGLKTHRHRTKAYLPISIARALKKSPELIQRAVEGFYVRDPSQLRTAARMTHFPPSSSILTPVTLTRAAYAQLQGQVFHPPRIFGPEWHVPENPNNEDEKRWRDLGVKIATGFEIMYKEGGKKSRTGIENETDSIKQNEEYQTFLTNLRKAGWFGDEIEGSEKWQIREKEAIKGYQSIKSADTAAQRPSFAYLVDTAISSSSDDPAEALTVDKAYLEDSESWLEVSPDELDGMMMRASGRAGSSVIPGENEKIEIGEEHGQALQDLAKKVENFVGGQGDMTGARFEDELSDDDMDDSEDDSDDERNMRQALEADKESRMKNLVPSLPAEEWGSKAHPQGTSSSTSVVMEHDDMSEKTIPKSMKPNQKKEVKFDHKDINSSSMRPPKFAKQEYDGVVSDSSDEGDESESELPPVGTLGRKIAQMKWSEGDIAEPKIQEINDDEDGRADQLDLDEEMQRRVWGDSADIDDDGKEEEEEDDGMDLVMEEEQEDFLKFAKDALGINDDLWKGILGDRQARGAFVPQNGSSSKFTSIDLNTSAPENEKKVSFAHPPNTSRGILPESQGNPSLTSFESVMKAMDQELSKNKPAPPKPKFNPKVKTKSKTKLKTQNGTTTSDNNSLPPLPTEEDLEAMDEDDLIAMDRELKAALKNAGISDDESDEEMNEGVKELGEDDKREYEMMKHFLESYRSQSGQSGVVGNLFGRLGQDQK